jgi:hypothetical protein
MQDCSIHCKIAQSSTKKPELPLWTTVTVKLAQSRHCRISQAAEANPGAFQAIVDAGYWIALKQLLLFIHLSFASTVLVGATCRGSSRPCLASGLTMNLPWRLLVIKDKGQHANMLQLRCMNACFFLQLQMAACTNGYRRPCGFEDDGSKVMPRPKCHPGPNLQAVEH